MKLPETYEDAIARIFDLEVENAKLKGRLEERSQPVSSSAPEPREDDHILHGGKTGRSTAARRLWAQEGRDLPGKGSMLTVVCDEPDCINPAHREAMTRDEARTFNTMRVIAEVMALGHDGAFDLLMDQSVRLPSGHTVIKDGSGMLHLPSGRNVGPARVSIWAEDDLEEFPKSVTRECKHEGCITPTHLKVTQA